MQLSQLLEKADAFQGALKPNEPAFTADAFVELYHDGQKALKKIVGIFHQTTATANK